MNMCSSMGCIRNKYVVLCVSCGAIKISLAAILITIYMMMRSNTSTIHYFQTIPIMIPAISMLMNGSIVMCLSQTRIRYIYLIGMCGVMCATNALLLVLQTITTSVIHINRLQSLQECVYTPKLMSCTCITQLIAVPINSSDHKLAHHFSFQDTPNCEVIHGTLFTCIRILFGVSVFGIILCLFGCMLIYQLMSHEKKKKYLQQLEIRRRFAQQHNHSHTHCHIPQPLPRLPLLSPSNSRCHLLRHAQQTFGCVEQQHYLSQQLHSPSQPLDYPLDYRHVNNARQFRTNSWTNWLNWRPRNQQLINNNSNGNNRGFFSSLFGRNNESDNICHNIESISRIASNSSLHWRSINGSNFLPPPHVWIPRMTSSGSTLPLHFASNQYDIRSRLLSAMNLHNRRTRSNEQIMGCSELTNCSMEAMWGPPPPYTTSMSMFQSQSQSQSQPQSLNTSDNTCNNVRHSHTHSHSSKLSTLSTPIAERRMHCNAFTSQGIRLTIGGSDCLNHTNVMNSLKGSCIVEIHVPYDEKFNTNNIDDQIRHKAENKFNSSNIFNTLPNVKRNDLNDEKFFNPFKSLSNIPINKLINNETQTHNVKGNDKHEYRHKRRQSLSCVPISNQYWNARAITSSLSSCHSLSGTGSGSNSLSDTTTTTSSENTTTCASFPVDPPTDYKSTVMQLNNNTQSSPVSLTDITSVNIDNETQLIAKNSGINYAHSMPNINCLPLIATSKSSPKSGSVSSNTTTINTRCSDPQYWDIHRIPSSGDTSTSQDFADFEFDLDDQPIKFEPKPNMNISTDHMDCDRNVKSTTISISANVSLRKLISDSMDMSSSTDSSEFVTVSPPTPFNNNAICCEQCSELCAQNSSKHKTYENNIPVIINKLINSIQV